MVITRQVKIYVIHGDPIVARTVAEFLGDLEYEAVPLHAADDLEASLEAESPQTAAVVVAQLETLGIDPAGWLRRIRARRPNVAFLLMDDGGFPAGEAVACGVRRLSSPAPATGGIGTCPGYPRRGRVDGHHPLGLMHTLGNVSVFPLQDYPAFGDSVFLAVRSSLM